MRAKCLGNCSLGKLTFVIACSIEARRIGRDFKMTGLVRSSADLDPRRRRILFRAWHRGIREMDLLFGRYMDAHVRAMSDDELDEIEALMRLPDQELLKWIDGREATPANQNAALIDRIRAYSVANPVTSDSGTAH